MNTNIYLFFTFLTTTCIFGQSFEKAVGMGGPGYDQAKSVIRDDAGNSYILGEFSGTADFDPTAGSFTLTSNGDSDIFITKLDADLNFVWAKQIGGTYYDYATAINIDTAGNLLITGSFYFTVDFDPGASTFLLTAIERDAFVLKLDSNGTFVWAKSWGGNNLDTANSLIVDSATNVYIGGTFAGNCDFDPGPGTDMKSSAGFDDAFILKLAANGNYVWSATFGGAGYDKLNSVALDASENIYGTGNFEGPSDFDPGPGSFILDSEGAFFVKLDSSRNLVWAKQTVGNGDTTGNHLQLDSSNNMYATGYFGGTTDFDPGSGVYNLVCTSGYYDIFILKLDGNGNFVWAKGFGGSASMQGDNGLSLSLNEEGYLYCAGTFNGSGDFDPGSGVAMLYPVGFVDAFISKFETDGDFVYAINFGSPNDITFGSSVAVDNTGMAYLTGGFHNTVDFDMGSGVYNLTSTGSSDIFLLKLDGTLGIPENMTPTISLYPNPNHGDFSIALDKHYAEVTVEISNILGQFVSSSAYVSAKIIEEKITASPGIYFMTVNIANVGVQTLRVIKQ